MTRQPKSRGGTRKKRGETLTAHVVGIGRYLFNQSRCKCANLRENYRSDLI